MSQFGGPAD